MEEMKEKVRRLLEEGVISGFLGLKLEYGHPAPHLFTLSDPKALELLTVGDARYPLDKILLKIVASHPAETFGVMVRGCDQRSFLELAKENQISLEKVLFCGVACPEELARQCGCPTPYPSQVDYGQPVRGVEATGRVAELEQMQEGERLRFWSQQFGKCLKCFGCRNICPVCYCPHCTLEDTSLVLGGVVPAEFPLFHLIKAMHMTGRCIDCGLCEEACPVGIPLRSIYRRMNQVMQDLFSYLPGRGIDEKSPLGVLEETQAASVSGKS